jgi:AP-3 complex subunit beta
MLHIPPHSLSHSAVTMAALNRLTQRIKENFIESTRDIQLLTGGAGSSTPYFDTSDDKIKEISKLLESRSERDRLEAMKRIIAGLSKGRDMEGFFAQVVKNVVAGSIEIRKLVYIFLLR